MMVVDDFAAEYNLFALTLWLRHFFWLGVARQGARAGRRAGLKTVILWINILVWLYSSLLLLHLYGVALFSRCRSWRSHFGLALGLEAVAASSERTFCFVFVHLRWEFVAFWFNPSLFSYYFAPGAGVIGCNSDGLGLTGFVNISQWGLGWEEFFPGFIGAFVMLAFGVHFGEQGLRSIIILEVLFGFKHVFLLFFLEVKYQVLEVWLQNPGGPFR